MHFLIIRAYKIFRNFKKCNTGEPGQWFGLSLYFQIKKGGPVVIIIFSQHSIIFCRLWLKLLILQAMDAIKKLYSSLPKDDIKRLEKEVTYICLLQLNRLPCSIALVVWFLIFPSYRLMIWQKKKKYQDCRRCMQGEIEGN